MVSKVSFFEHPPPPSHTMFDGEFFKITSPLRIVCSLSSSTPKKIRYDLEDDYVSTYEETTWNLQPSLKIRFRLYHASWENRADDGNYSWVTITFGNECPNNPKILLNSDNFEVFAGVRHPGAKTEHEYLGSGSFLSKKRLNSKLHAFCSSIDLHKLEVKKILLKGATLNVIQLWITFRVRKSGWSA